MSLADVFLAVRPAIVALMPSAIPVPAGGIRPDLFPIIGTGFILDDGLVVTNAHVIEALYGLPRPSNWPAGKMPFKAVLFYAVDQTKFPNVPTEGYAEIPLQVLGVFHVGDLQLSANGIYYGPRKPDFSIVHVKAKGLPKIELLADTGALSEGVEVATVGFPMGTEALTAPGWLHQLGPFLQRGVISAVLPFACKAPHSFVINVMSLGGASGSPVFFAENGKAIGILNAGLTGPSPTFTSAPGKPISTGVALTPTNFSYVVPAYLLANVLERIKADATFALPEDTLSLDEMIQKATFEIAKKRVITNQIREIFSSQRATLQVFKCESNLVARNSLSISKDSGPH